MTNLVGQTLGGYAVLEQLGAGGMGAVFKAKQPVLDRIVALKVIAPQVAQDPSFIARFQHEAKSAARLNHPNIVQVYAAGEESGTHFMVSEFVEGESLQQRLKREGPMDPQEALAVCVFVAEGLKHAWDEARIIHRDIKPANIFLSNKGAVKVGDLGLAKSVAPEAGSALTQSGAMMGTPYYCSPEQAQGEKGLDFRADIYSLGCTLYHMLSGKRPYETGVEQSAMSIMVKQVHDPPPAILQLLPACPMPLVLLLNKMLAKHPNGRHASYDELIADLRRVHDMLGQPQSVEPVSSAPATPAAGTKSRAMMWTAVAGVAALLLAGLFVWAPWRAGQETGSKRQVEAPQVGSAGVPPAVEQKPQPKEEPKPLVTAQPTVEVVPAKPLEKTPEAVVETAKPAVPDVAPAAVTTTTMPVEEKPTVPEPKAEDTFAKDVAALPPEQQVARVAARLKELNLGFDGRETHKVEGGAVTELSFSTAGVTDITPLKTLKWLKKLVIVPPTLNQKGALADLAPLQGLPLTWLWCHGNPITDLAPLRGMPLTVLSFSGTQVGDLAPLSGMKLAVLSFSDTPVADLAPLQDMPLTVLWCNNTKVTTLSPLQAMPLQELRCDFVPARDAAVLRGIKTLAKINDMAAGMFWIRVGPIAATVASRQPFVPAAATSGAQKTMTTSTGIELVWIPPGEFMLGSTAEEHAGATNEGNQPRRTVIRYGFWMGRTETTVGPWKRFVDAINYKTDAEKKGHVDHAAQGKGLRFAPLKDGSWRDPSFGFKLKDNHPVSCVSWDDAVAFCEWLTETEKKAGKLPAGMVYRLPTEAEWEYACRAGTQTKFWWGNSEYDAERRCNLATKADGFEFISVVDHFGIRGRNKFGLADMAGNVREWVLDAYDPAGAHAELFTDGPARLLRGGGFDSRASFARCASRDSYGRTTASCVNGFRLCCGLPEGSGQAGTSTTVAPATRISPPLTPVMPTAPASPAGPEKTMMTSTGMELVWIPPGEFMIGSTPEERAWALQNGCSEDYVKREGDAPRKTAVKQGFWLGKTEVTVGQWKLFVAATGYVTDGEKKGESYTSPGPGQKFAPVKGANWMDSNFGFKLKDNYAACCISWNDAVAFCAWLNEREAKAGRLPPGCKVRLPTEAEWEYACRAGKQTKFWWGETKEGGDNRLNWIGKGDGFEFVSPVDHYGSRGRNKFGLADMLGNVWEWCLDEFDEKQAHEECYRGNLGARVLRGGSFYFNTGHCRAASRVSDRPSSSSGASGFRVLVGVER
ncbi:MAG: SUMF1/EgtB/PvdO family nonheme iron enzyme [Verrucomicrobia bacterium]|nr:SUMF1/EgtB/PvdO family nonheme iron enzyme [Verrucomicrobiota bacterium]